MAKKTDERLGAAERAIVPSKTVTVWGDPEGLESEAALQERVQAAHQQAGPAGVVIVVRYGEGQGGAYSTSE
jgi:hypothetical protein